MKVHNPPVYKRPFNAFDNKTLEQRVQELMDREEIRDVINRYAQYAGQGRGDLMGDLFTEDAILISFMPVAGRKPLELRGRVAISNQYMRMQWGVTIPQIHNCLISVSGDTADSICSQEIRMIEGGQSVITSGYREDSFRRVNGRWLFSSRISHGFHWVPIQKGWADATPQRPED
jgi:hypothetical protein